MSKTTTTTTTTTIITSPSAALMPGEHSSFFGDRAIVFRDGVAKVDNISDALRGYFEANGFGVNDSEPTPPPEPVEPPDPRDYDTPEQIGTDLRDAAVDPQSGDFLVPTNAGEANPHGGDVVSPGIHALQDVRPIKGGPVTFGGDTDAQDVSETAHAAEATDGTPVALTEDERDLLGVPDDIALDQLKGDALALKLTELGLSEDGTADEKRTRIRVALTDPEELKGADLDTALKDAGIKVSGTVAEKRYRLTEYRATKS